MAKNSEIQHQDLNLQRQFKHHASLLPKNYFDQAINKVKRKRIRVYVSPCWSSLLDIQSLSASVPSILGWCYWLSGAGLMTCSLAAGVQTSRPALLLPSNLGVRGSRVRRSQVFGEVNVLLPSDWERGCPSVKQVNSGQTGWERRNPSCPISIWLWWVLLNYHERIISISGPDKRFT